MNVFPTTEDKTYQDLEKSEQDKKSLYQQLSGIRLSQQFNQTEVTYRMMKFGILRCSLNLKNIIINPLMFFEKCSILK